MTTHFMMFVDYVVEGDDVVVDFLPDMRADNL
jgi:hypothetical protein